MPLAGADTVRSGLAALLVTLSGCSPIVRFELRVTVEGVEDPHAARLHISTSADPTEPVPDPWSEPRPHGTKVIVGDAGVLNVTLVEKGPSDIVTLDARFWYDADGDGRVSDSDRVGRFAAPVTGQDRGLLGNTTEVAPVHLQATPSPDARPPAAAPPSPAAR